MSYSTTTQQENFGLDSPYVVTANRKPILKQVKAPQGWPALLFPKMVYGLEFEVEGVADEPAKLTTIGKVWDVKADGSLRNGGMEFTICSRGQDLLSCLYWLYDHLPEGAVFSERTSTHVHVNVQNLTNTQVYALALLGMVLEDFLYRFTLASRKTDVYCVPLKYTLLPSTMNYVRSLMRSYSQAGATLGRSRDEMLNLMSGWSKYLGINLIRIRDIGTVEFRHLHGTKDMPLVIQWLNVIGKMKAYVMKYTLEELENEICGLNTSSEYLPFLERVFGKKLLYFFDLAGFEDVLEEGVIAAKLCTENYHYDELSVSDQSSLAKLSPDALTSLGTNMMANTMKLDPGEWVHPPEDEDEVRHYDEDEDEEGDD